MKSLWEFSVVCLILIIVRFAHPTHSAPFDAWVVYNSMKQYDCKSAVRVDLSMTSSDVEDLCQYCTMSTKSPTVYKMCCNNTDDVQHWCLKALKFGN